MRPDVTASDPRRGPHLALRGAALGGVLLLVLPWDLVLLALIGALGLWLAPPRQSEVDAVAPGSSRSAR